MCDLRTFDRIEKIVEQRMAAGRMFTAFDITLALQKKGITKLHREIRRDIKRVADGLMWRFGFERTLVSFREIDSNAFVYHPFGTDASSHRPSIRPRALASTKRRRSPATRGVAQSGVNQDQCDMARMPDELAKVLGLTPAGEDEIALDVATGLVIIIRQREPDVN
jgi:hypothetical protein